MPMLRSVRSVPAAVACVLVFAATAGATEPPAFVGEYAPHGTGTGELRGPRGLAVDRAGFVYVADTDNDRIVKFDPDGHHVTTWGGTGSDPGRFDYPCNLAIGRDDHV